MSPDEDEELTAAAIARLAGVGRAAVTNWRSRHPSFPKPVGGSRHSPTFSRAEVEAWLRETGKDAQLATAGQTDTGTQRVTWPAESLADARTSATSPGRAVTDLTPGQLLARIMASLLPRTTTVARYVDADEIPEVPVVLDPACADGTLLMAVADRFGDHVKVAGQEIDESAAATAALNLRANYIDQPYEVHAGDSLLANQLASYAGAAAGVVCEPPFDQPQWPADELATDPRWEFGVPAPRDGELAWVQHCYAHLRPRGVAVVAVTPRTCVQPSGRHIRAALVRSGALRDVIALPGGMSLAAPGSDVYVWVLQRPYGRSTDSNVRLIDLSKVGDPADVPHEFAAWEQLLEELDPAIAKAVPRLELLDEDVNLLPSRHLGGRVEASADDFTRLFSRLRVLHTHVGQLFPRFSPPAAPTHHSYVTLSELERSGTLTIRSRDATPRAGDLLVRTLGRPPIVATGTAEDDTGIAQVVEIDATRLDAHFLAAFLRSDANALPVTNTLGALSRADLRRCRVPRLPLAEQRRYGESFRHLQQLEEVLAALAKTGAHVIDQTIHGLTTGILSPGLGFMKNTDDVHVVNEETSAL
ncbi:MULTISPECIES: N-6 DNA methylase [Microbispora]|uniref:N-6 DNA methylase n=1 Tax=Microbispora bryophytorum subsp. camponoti TaxID=1677852 RepID=A0ABR8L8J8_9ACTN|nr:MULTISPECIES: N-6 DNA methylase [Microbispora]MBD3146322.1 N-6 DNA methylase [Microbispora camponoti]